MTDFAKILRAVRHLRHLTQEQAAETFDIPLWTLRRIERGKRDLKFPEIERIARCCGMSVSEMLQLEKEEVFLPPPAPFEQKEHFEKVIAAQNEHIASLLEEIKNLYGVMKN
jgi:transcriptional regulator with XRE-family HTH domain